jgi:hypothetical protein
MNRVVDLAVVLLRYGVQGIGQHQLARRNLVCCMVAVLQLA